MEKQTSAQRPKRSAQEQMLRGSAWMTAGSIFSRILGAIYIVPWRIWMGAAFLTANALFTKGYQIYSVFLIIGTAGIPSAISKQVAHYNAMNEYKTGLRLFFNGLLLMAGMGLLSCGALWFLAPILAVHDPALTQIFRSLAWPLLLIPILSILRGFFQGYNEMAPSAISQFIEQVVDDLHHHALRQWQLCRRRVTVHVCGFCRRGIWFRFVGSLLFAATPALC
jgi:O-antigen/teichoic acid export membrane protein